MPQRHLRVLSITSLLLLCCDSAVWGQADTLRLDGLAAPVEIVTDRWGIAHIYAGNEEDLFFAQGYNAARDRLFQFEVWRRQATGTTAEILGRRELKRDIGARLHRFRGDISRELNHYHPRGERIVGAFVRGVNARVEETRRDPSLLPIEFRLLGIEPGLWTPEVVISRHQGLLGNVGQELETGRAVAHLGAERVRELSWFHPNDPKLELEPGIDASLLDRDVLELYDAFRDPLRFRPEDLAPEHRGDAGALALLQSALPGERAMALAGDPIGSNNWVVSGRLSADGKPMMANDPHRAHQAPSLRYWAHLVAPGWNVMGGGEPVLPGISIGHNEHGAWGLTIFGVDGEDLYVYETDPSDPRRYRYAGQWEAMRVERETIRVEGEAPVEVELLYTRHGPVLHQDPAGHRAVALRAAWMGYGAAPYLASLRMDQARSWEEFRAASEFSFIPGENMVWADTAGNIGYQAVGISPIRRSWSGMVPVPGDGRFEWDGFLPIRDLPNALNPSKGFWATANNNMVPEGYPFPEAVGYSWADPFRALRIEEVLASGRRFTVEEMARLQHDELSIPARTLTPLLGGAQIHDARLARAGALLAAWDHRLSATSPAAGTYVAWERYLSAGVHRLSTSPAERAHIRRLPLKRTVDALVSPDSRFGADPARGRDSLLVAALDSAVTELERRFGPDPAAWRYGQEKYKHALIRHPLSAAVSPELRAQLEVGPAPRGGYGNTVNATGGGDNQTSGASFRIVAATADWDRSIGTNTPGQSGDPASPHYRDLFPLWARGEYFPLAYSRSAVEAVAERRTVLAPAR